MVFNSLVFIFFFAVVLAVHYLPISWRVRKGFLLAASYVFYGAWNPPFVLLLMFSTVVDWFAAKAMSLTTNTARRRLLIIVSLVVNLGLLGFFKYGTFLLQNWVALLHAIGVDYHPAVPNIVLPVGISFYIFQTLSYTLDVYTGRDKPWNSFLDFALYVTFFPQLVAGPIVRSGDFLPQLEKPRRATNDMFGWGLAMLVLGLFEKIVVADGFLAPVADKVFHPGVHAGFVAAWVGTFAFAGQIFCDFAGYSTCAIGVAGCMGFTFMENFRYPYAAIGFSDFWRRWHISLSTWLRDYLYIPLGGNRRGKVRTDINLWTTMLLGGLWHGASWTFVVWGGLHGAFLVLERAVRRSLERLHIPATRPLLMVGALLTFLLVCITWVFFRAKTFASAFALVAAMFGAASKADANLLGRGEIAIVVFIMTILLGVHWQLRDRGLQSVASRTSWPLRAVALAVMLILLVTVSGEDRAFIYFQF